MLSAVPEMRPPDYDVLRGLCGDAQPLVAGIAECIASYLWEYEHDIDHAIASARRMIAALTPVDNPSLLLMGHSRLSELCLRTGQGEAAYEHLKEALEVLPRLGDEHDYIGIRWALALACLQRGDPDEAEYWQQQAEGDSVPHQDTFYSPDLGGRAEIALARGLVEVGLGLWRGAVQRIPEAGSIQSGDPWLDPWALQILSAAVTAHAHAGRLELVAQPLDRLRRGLRTLLSTPQRSPMELPVFGTVLHALGRAGLASGDVRAVRMIALAERLRVLREFQPTMSVAHARLAVAGAGHAVGVAYADAVAGYAALTRDELREATRALIADRG